MGSTHVLSTVQLITQRGGGLLHRKSVDVGLATFRQICVLRNEVFGARTCQISRAVGQDVHNSGSSCFNSVANKLWRVNDVGLKHLSTTSRMAKGFGDEDAVFTNPFSKNFGNFVKVLPGNVSDVQRKIPEHIIKPDYWESGHPSLKLGPKTIEIKSAEAIAKMRKACYLTRKVLNAAMKLVKPGLSTQDLDDFVFEYTIAQGAYPSPLNYKGFPKSVCTSVNNVACHGIPDDRALVDGDIVNIDVMVYIDGYHGDCSETVLVGNVDDQGRKLVEAAKACLDHGILICGPGVPFQRIGQVIEDVAEEKGFSVVPCFTGHGIGHQIHAAPDIYHYEALIQHHTLDNKFLDFPYPGKMEVGMTFTIEPVLAQGMEDIVILEDGWTAVTLDCARTAQFEHTILITDYGAEILTLDENQN